MYFLLLLPLIPLNNKLPYPTMHIHTCVYMYLHQLPVCKDSVQALVCWCLGRSIYNCLQVLTPEYGNIVYLLLGDSQRFF